jgi:hypothetical protein
MSLGFRFLVVCNHATEENELFTLRQVLDSITMDESAFPFDLQCTAAIGVVLEPHMWGKSLHLMAWQLGKNGERETLVKYRGTPLILPNELIGALTLPYEISVPIWNPGIYGFDLFDPTGIFGQPESLLATYLYLVDSR